MFYLKMKISIKRIFSFVFLLLLSLESVPCKFLKSKFVSLAESDAIVTITKDSESELLDAVKILNKSGGTIYIDTKVINISSKSTIKLTGDKPGGIVGLR